MVQVIVQRARISNRGFARNASVRYPLRRRSQHVTMLQPAHHAYARPYTAPAAPQQASWGQRMLIALGGWACGVTADSLVMFAEHHFHLAKDRDPDLFALVLGTGFAGHAIYLVFAALAVTLLTAFRRQKWILWLLIGFVCGLLSI